MSKSDGEYDERLATMMTSMEAHIKADAIAFAALIDELKEVNADVKAILAARNYAAGVWKTVTIIGSIVAAAIGLYIAYVKH